MGFFRFRRSIKIAPGVRINLSKSGVSTSLGVRGAHVTVGHGKVRETVGVPGTGLSYTEQQRASSSGLGGVVLLVIFALAVIAFLVSCATGPGLHPSRAPMSPEVPEPLSMT